MVPRSPTRWLPRPPHYEPVSSRIRRRLPTPPARSSRCLEWSWPSPSSCSSATRRSRACSATPRERGTPMLNVYLRLVAAALSDLRSGERDEGSVTLEQIAITAGLLALAIGVVAGIGVAVAKYMGKL